MRVHFNYESTNIPCFHHSSATKAACNSENNLPFFVRLAFFKFHFNQILSSMRRLSFKIANHEKELFGGHYEGQERLQLSRFSFDIAPSSLLSSSKSRRSFCRNSSSASTASSIVSSRKSVSYDKIDQAPIHLTIVKLDGSSFGIIHSLNSLVKLIFFHLLMQMWIWWCW